LNEEATQPITSVDFQEAWSTMNPSYEKYSALLEESMAFNAAPDQKLILLCYTNYLDVFDMQKNGVDVNPLAPVALNSMEFHASYHEHATAPELLQRIAQNLFYPDPSIRDSLFGNQKDKLDIVWVYTGRNSNEARARFGTAPDAMLEVCDGLGIRPQVWDKDHGMTLTDALRGVPVASVAQEI